MPGQQITARGASVDVYLARPATPDPAPGVVVLHDIAGLGSDVRAQADWLAGEGFLAAAPDLFDGGTLLRCLRSTTRDYTTRRGRTFDLIEATRTWLAADPRQRRTNQSAIERALLPRPVRFRSCREPGVAFRVEAAACRRWVPDYG